jgi:hypothetical protein
LAAILTATLFCGCAYVPPSNDKAQWYATLEDVSGKRVLQINSNECVPLLGSEGFGGSRRVMLYFADIDGDGPVYQNPKFGKNSTPRLKSDCLGTINVDIKEQKVIIDLQQIISNPGEPLKTEPCPANGTYPLKHWKDRLSPR